MDDLHTVDSHCRKFCDALHAAIRPGVRDHRNPSTSMYQIDRLGDPDAPLVEIGRPAGAEVPIEGVAEVHRPAILDHRASHMRAADRGVTGHREDVVEGDAHAEFIQPFHDRDRPVTARHAEHRERVAHLIEVSEVQTQDVCLLLAFVRAQLDTRDQFQPRTGGGRSRFLHSCHRVVVGQRDRAQSCLTSQCDNTLGRDRPIRGRGMKVQVDVPRADGRGVARHGE